MLETTCRRCGAALVEGSPFCPACGRRNGSTPRPHVRRNWWKVFAIGFVLYLATSKLLAASGNPNLVPTVILLGAFLVPVTYVVFLYETGALYDVPPATMALTFFYGGVLGVIAAQFLEQQLVVGMGLFAMMTVAFCEELAKPLGTLWLLGRHDYVDELHGLILGGAAGMGFAALETMGYGFTYLILSRGNLDVLGQVLLSRGLLAPLAHGTWSAIVVGTIWRERMRGRSILSGPVLKGFLTAVILHGLWDWTAAAIPISINVSGTTLRWRFIDLNIPGINLPVPGLIIGAIGLFILWRMFRESQSMPVPAKATG